MVIEVLYKSFRYEKFDSSAQTNSEPFRAKGTNILTDWNLYLGALEENGIILAEHWYDGNPQHAGGQVTLEGTKVPAATRQVGSAMLLVSPDELDDVVWLKKDGENCSNKVATLTTNASGNANTVSLNPGRYYVKETKAPKGYFTDSQVYTADVSGANRESSPVKLSVSDNPANDPMSMLLGKFDGQKTYNGAGNLPQGSATLAGAEFTVDYYATLDYKSYDDLKNADVKPMRSWTFSTDSNGFCSFDIAHFVSGDAFWYRLDGTPALPRGTVVIRETR